MSTTIGEITVPEHAVEAVTFATNASHGQDPAAATLPSMTAACAVGFERRGFDAELSRALPWRARVPAA